MGARLNPSTGDTRHRRRYPAKLVIDENAYAQDAAAHKTVTYLAVVAALTTIATAGVFSVVSIAVAATAMALSWFAEEPRFPVHRLTGWWNVAAVVFLVVVALRVWWGEDVIVAGVAFLLFLLINRLFNRRSIKDLRQVHVLSFLLMIAATTLNTDISFAVGFVLYVVFITWALVFQTLRQEIADRPNHSSRTNPGLKQDALVPSRLIGRGFYGGTAVLSLCMVAGATFVFALFPRLGFGLFSGPRRHGLTMAGFSERVALGEHGTIRDNPRVVMRVFFGKPAKRMKLPPVRLLWRGAVFDRYENGVWSHSPDIAGRTAILTPRDGLYRVGNSRGLPPNASAEKVRTYTLRQEIYLEPMASTILFALDRPIALHIARTKIAKLRPFLPRRGPFGEVRASRLRTAGIRYAAFSQLIDHNPQWLRQAVPLEEKRFDRFLQTPDNLPERVRQLAYRITADKHTIYDKAVAVRDFLQRNLSYTVDLTAAGKAEPLDAFLFTTKRGHCEYFASAMAVLLRAVGIHSRHVNGFIGGQWNGYGEYLAVRQGDAHAWTEVLFSNVGWVAFDPTPGPGRVANAPAAVSFAQQLLDAARLRWFRYVVEYDLNTQLQLAAEIGRVIRKTRKGGIRPRGAVWTTVKRGAVALGAAGVFGVVVWIAWRRRKRWMRAWFRRGDRMKANRRAATAAYARMLQLLEGQNYPCKSPNVTPAEYAEQLKTAARPLAAAVGEVTHAYYQARFGPMGAEGYADAGTVVRQVDRLRKTLRMT